MTAPRMRALAIPYSLLVASLCMVLLWEGCSHQDTGPRQPIAFSHAIHAGQYQMNCQYCHSGVRRGANAYVPSVQTCMGCHQLVAATRPEVVKIRSAWEQQRPIVWTRMNRLADYVYFNHAPHIARGVQCETCHGDVAGMTELNPPFTVNNMSWCVDCHRENQASIDCQTCHR